MMNFMSSFKKIFVLVVFYFIFFNINSYSEIVNKVEVKGNKRISSNTIILFGDIQKGSDIDNKKLNSILKNLYETNFFENVR